MVVVGYDVDGIIVGNRVVETVGYGVVGLDDRVGEIVGYGVIGLELGLSGHSSVAFALTPQLPPIKTVSDDPNSPPLPSSLPFTETL